MLEINCTECKGAVPALLGEHEVECPFCKTRNPVADEVQHHLSAVAAERARTDASKRSLEKARKLVGQAGWLGPIQDMGCLLVIALGSFVVSVTLVVFGPSAYLSWPWRLVIGFVIEGAVAVAVFWPFHRAVKRKQQAVLEDTRALSPLEPDRGPRCRACGAEMTSRDRGIAKCEYCEAECVLDDAVFRGRERRLRTERTIKDAEARAAHQSISGVTFWFEIFMWLGLLTFPLYGAAYCQIEYLYPYLMPYREAPPMPEPPTSPPGRAEVVLAPRHEPGRFVPAEVRDVSKGEALICFDRGIDWAILPVEKLLRAEILPGHRLEIRCEDQWASAVAIGKLGSHHEHWVTAALTPPCGTAKTEVNVSALLLVEPSEWEGRKMRLLSVRMEALGWTLESTTEPMADCDAATKVTHLVPDGPAARAGVRVGDGVEVVSTPFRKRVLTEGWEGEIGLLVRHRAHPPLKVQLCQNGQRRILEIQPRVQPASLSPAPPEGEK